MYHTVVSHSRNQNPCVFSVEVHGPAPAVIQIKAGHPLHLASLFHQPLGNGAAKEWGWSTLEPNPVDLFIRQSPFWGVQMVAVGRLKRQHSEQQRKRLMNFLSRWPVLLAALFLVRPSSHIPQGRSESPKPGTQCQPAGFLPSHIQSSAVPCENRCTGLLLFPNTHRM